tara:strand:- start:826 stop:1188 length:363 start_codon:yes stop_codon:yes gene_type:complete
MSTYSSEYKYVKQYLEYEFSGCDINEIMSWVSEYEGNIYIEVENGEWIRGDEDLMDFIQKKLIPDCDLSDDEEEEQEKNFNLFKKIISKAEKKEEKKPVLLTPQMLGGKKTWTGTEFIYV